MRAHDENFPVAFWLLPPEARADMHALYAFCRATDDLGDEGDPALRRERLELWREDTLRCFGGEPRDPRLRALAATVARHDLSPEPFTRLIRANLMDQERDRWPTYARAAGVLRPLGDAGRSHGAGRARLPRRVAGAA